MISIIIPIIRPDRVKECISAIREHSDGIEYEMITMNDDKRIGAPKMVKKLVELANFDLIMFLGDDTVPQPGFLKEALSVMGEFEDGWGLVGLNDGTVLCDMPGVPATHWLAHKKLLDCLDGEFFHTGYWHCFCDNELTERCRGLSRYRRADNAMIRHKHPLLDKTPSDADYKRVYSPKYMTHDRILFQQRKAGENWSWKYNWE